jgi:hypothetical protein
MITKPRAVSGQVVAALDAAFALPALDRIAPPGFGLSGRVPSMPK